MQVSICPTPSELGKAAGLAAARLIREVIQKKDLATIILATGTSQFETLNHLCSEPGIDWSKVIMFHLDEYIGLPESAPASFRKYLKERFLANVPPLKAVYLINGEGEAQAECDRLGELIKAQPVDVALVGIGENGHLAFNDPPANFETEAPYIIVDLDQDCRKQQMGEGWFETLDDVLAQAISMSVKQIMKSEFIICSVPDSRKAEAVKNTLEQPVSNLYPASILQQHPKCTLYLDLESAGMLTSKDY